MRNISPYQAKGRKVWLVQFRNPSNNNRNTNASLKTRDQMLAKALCRDIGRLCDDSTLWDTVTAIKAGIRQRAIDIFLAHRKQSEPEEDQDPLSRLLRKHADVNVLFDDDKLQPHRFGFMAADSELDIIGQILERTDAAGFATREQLTNMLSAAPELAHIGELNRKINELTEKVTSLEASVQVLEPENEQLREENTRLRRSKNLDVKATIGKAFDWWETVYPEGHAAITIQQAASAIQSFIGTLPSKKATRLRDISDTHIDTWVREMKLLDGSTCSPVTKKKRKAYVSKFFTMITKHFKLSANPIETTDAIAGLDRNAATIEAIRNLDDLNAYLKGLKKQTYWHAWCAVACLAGPRWAEQVHMRVSDIDLKQGTLRVSNTDEHGTKTGGEREIPLERSILLPTLETYLESRRSKTPWLFPSLVKMRGRSTGTWSYKAFSDAFKAARQKAKGKAKETYWRFTSKQHRHTFGTLLFRCNWQAFQISRAMGNSPEMCERYYCAGGYSGQPLPLKYGN